MFKASCYFTHNSLYLAIMLRTVCFQQLSQLLMLYIIAVWTQRQTSCFIKLHYWLSQGSFHPPANHTATCSVPHLSHLMCQTFSVIIFTHSRCRGLGTVCMELSLGIPDSSYSPKTCMRGEVGTLNWGCRFELKCKSFFAFLCGHTHFPSEGEAGMNEWMSQFQLYKVDMVTLRCMPLKKKKYLQPYWKADKQQKSWKIALYIEFQI